LLVFCSQCLCNAGLETSDQDIIRHLIMHYIRFLKTPILIISRKGSASLKALITITTDLAESLFPEYVKLRVCILTLRPKHVGHSALQQEIYWNAGDRKILIDISVPREMIDMRMKIFVLAANETYRFFGSHRGELIMPVIVPVMSGFVDCREGKLSSGNRVQRYIDMTNGKRIHVWEDTGESIARHVWCVQSLHV